MDMEDSLSFFLFFKGVGGQGGQEARLIYTTEAI